MLVSLKSRLLTVGAPLILCITAAGNLWLSWHHAMTASKIAFHPGSKNDQNKYSYVGTDYPDYYPMDRLPAVMMTTEDSVHYPLSGPTAAAQWASNNPPGGGYVHLGEPRRYLCVSMFHQLHCLRYIRQGLITAEDPYATISHMQHCLNYLRQAILCQPDLTLEDPGWRDSPWSPGKRGSTHTCKDWSLVYDEMNKNHQEWEEWKNTTNGIGG